ncbi:unnamed protein product [Effrenium voratum]|uniref:Protein ENHANCED DISEASE RESISTANCE 2 C-terminal domain-containing protein n=1 Tax=Effrenium voratum TaxID=2562239 RepID=A0AA36NG66_9DINO|nr:unnamed protein product [Effrenium voratum]
MGQGSSLECCNVRGRVCEVDSLFGEDDFFREARWDDFHECQEGSSEHDDLFHAASEQAWLKCAKGTLAASYASFELHRRARRAISAISSLSGSRQEGDPPPVTLNASEEVNSASQWLGRTMAQWTKDELPPTGEGPYWARGDGKGLMVRQGPNYKKFRNKAQSQGSMYSCVSCDAIRSTVKVQDIVGRLVPVEDLPSQETFAAHCPAASSSSARWSTACKLPRVICMNLMLPYDTGIVPWRQEDPGASFVAFFHINPTTVSSSMSKEPSPEVRQLIDFFSGPAGAPQGDRSDPDRSLAGRLEPGRKKDVQSGIFKANAKCLNPEDVNVPEMLNAPRLSGSPWAACLALNVNGNAKAQAGNMNGKVTQTHFGVSSRDWENREWGDEAAALEEDAGILMTHAAAQQDKVKEQGFSKNESFEERESRIKCMKE